LAKFDAGDRTVPIRVLLEENARADRQVLEQVRVPSQRGGGVPLVALADITFGEGPTSITRHDRQRQASVEADLVGKAEVSDAANAVKELSVMKNLPPGVKVSDSGEAELQAELFEQFGGAMRYGLMTVYVVLAILFAGLLQPMTILFSLPLSIAGAFLALFITSSSMTTPVVIGILMLMGIVTKNAIMLVDFAVEAMHHGLDRTAAIIDAGKKRARPIIMTTIAMAAGMTPSALALGAGGEFRSPMAIAVVGGLLVSTLLSLLFVPAFFTLMDDFGQLMLRASRRFIGRSDEPPSGGAASHATTPAAPAPEPAKSG
jgi:multidrug efflux pump subunit AcrB